MGDVLSFSPVQISDANGNPIPGAKAFFFLSGTTTPAVVYSDVGEAVPHATPVVANAAGVFPAVFRSGVSLKAVIYTADDVAIYTIDPVSVSSVGGSAASQISFSATGAIPENNVQAAIERVQANFQAPLLAGGIGVTGDAVDIGSLDATNKPSGMYRFTATTTGARPAGVGAGDTGTVWIFRETSQNAVMCLVKRGETKIYARALAASTWGAWADPAVLNSPTINGTPSGTAVQSSVNDHAAGKLARSEFLVSPGQLLTSSNNLNTITTPGRYYYANGSVPSNAPPTSGPIVGAFLVVEPLAAAISGAVMQVAYVTEGNQVFPGLPDEEYIAVWRRLVAPGVALKWNQEYNRINVVGTVSQSASIPTGAVIESGSNANGNYVRFADGAQSCWIIIDGTLDINDPVGVVFQTASNLTWTYPIAFSSSPVLTGALIRSARAGGVTFGSASATSCVFRPWTTPATLIATPYTIMLEAKGRWF